MAEPLARNAIAGVINVASSTPDDDAEHIVHPSWTFVYDDLDTPLDCVHLVGVAQTAIALTEAYVVPRVTQATDATNFVTLTLKTGNLAAGSLTSLDAMTTNSSGGAALTARTKRSFTIVPSTDTLAKGTGLYIDLTHAASTVGVIAYTLVVNYKLTG